VNRSLDLLAGLAARETCAAALERFNEMQETIRRRQRAMRSYAEQAARIAEVEAELIDAKIGARVSGLMSVDAGNGDVIGAIESHVQGVLRASQFGTMLEKRLMELEEEIAERKLTSRAKAVLQSAHGMSEEQAHLHLRTISRRSRRPLKEIAREVIWSGVSAPL
jgi:AmiR/NasT family two-component response regulator